VTYARRALDLAAEDDHFRRGAAAALLGLASWTSGDLEAAHRSYADGMVHLQKAGNISDAVGGAMTSADIRIAQGRLRDAMRTYEHALRLATEQGDPAMRGTADMYVGMSELERERGDLEAATRLLITSKEQGEHTGFQQNRYRWCVAMARIREARGDLDGALDLLEEAERLYVSDFSPDVRPISALRTRVWVAQGRLGEALGWARERGLSAHDDLGYLRECEHITLARVLIAEYERDHADRAMREAMELLERLLYAAEVGGRTGSVLEILVLRALAHQIRGDVPAALVPLERALKLAEPEDYVRTFVDEGPPMEHLLLEAAARGIVPGYTRKLLAAFGAEARRRVGRSRLPASPVSHPLIEPLSERELEVLRLFGTELSGPEIASELVVALSTVRTHTKSIYRKLGVKNRRAAVIRAAELGLV
jgi:LuxR family maltose regulon positive regulatory protein